VKFDVRSAIQFAAVAEDLSFRRAAERLHVAQPWLSTRIRKLEDQLGFPLFVRNTRNVELTAAGRVFLRDATALAAAARAAEQSAQMLQDQHSGRIRIGVPPYHAALEAKSLLIKKFTEIRPMASVELDVGWSAHLIDRLLDCNVDLAFILDFVPDPALEAVTLGLYQSVLAISRDEDIAHRERLNLLDLRGREVAVFTRGLNPALYDKLYGPLEAADIKLVQVTEFADLDVDRTGTQRYPLFTTLAWHGGAPADNPRIVIRSLADYHPEVPMMLVRRKAGIGQLQEEFWQLGRTLG
jgi:DNA-binding transcriptional LysR family regulator